jgi:hypothetical protein
MVHAVDIDADFPEEEAVGTADLEHRDNRHGETTLAAFAMSATTV